MAVNWQKEPPVAGDRRGAGRRRGRHAGRHPPRRRRAHAAQPEDGRSPRPASWGSRRSRPATGSPSTTTRTPRSSSTACAGTLTAELDGEPHEVNGGRGALHPDQRCKHRLRNEGDEDAFIVFHLGPLAPRARHRTRRHRGAHPEANARSPASASSRRAASTGRRSGSASPSGRTATRKITFFDPAGFRSQIAAEGDFDPHAAGLNEQEVRRMDRYIQFAVAAGDGGGRRRGPRPRGRRPRADGGHAGPRRRRDDGARGRLRRGLATAARSGSSTPSTRRRSSTTALVPSSLASEVALKFGAHGPVGRRSPPAAPRASTRSATATS